MRIEADNLKEAYQKVVDEFKCSITELDIQVIQHPSNGIMGFFKKTAILEVSKESSSEPRKSKKQTKEPRKPKEVKKPKEVRETKEVKETKTSKKEVKQEPTRRREKKPEVDINIALPQIQKGVSDLVNQSCFDINHIQVKSYDEETILIELNGEDAALLIGKEGYRYKAFSYLLYNWINIKFGYGIRLEIAQFLQNQEVMIEKYLTSIIERIQNNGRGQTKPLDGVLIKIALEILREKFPEKYVGIKTGREGVKFIVVNDFNKK